MHHFTETSGLARFWTHDPRIRGLVANVADGVIVIDTAGRIELFNPAAERLFGFAAEEVMGRNVAMLAPLTYRHRHEEGMARYLETGEAHIIGIGREVEGLRKDGTSFPMYMSVGEVQFPGFHGFIGVAHDLSEQKAAERALAGARGYLQDIIDSMPSMLVGLDVNGRITHWNRAAARVCKVPAGTAVGLPFEELFPFLQGETQAVKRAVRAGEAFKRERLPYPAGGETRYADVVVYPLAGEATPGAVVRIDDVTERVRMEETMVQTEKMMSVGGLAAGMAHEINNPLGILAQGCQNLIAARLRRDPGQPCRRRRARRGPGADTGLPGAARLLPFPRRDAGGHRAGQPHRLRHARLQPAQRLELRPGAPRRTCWRRCCGSPVTTTTSRRATTSAASRSTGTTDLAPTRSAATARRSSRCCSTCCATRPRPWP